jgi:hypothetical protein
VDECLGFDDLFRAANGRAMTAAERASLDALPQREKNEWVKRQVAATSGALWCEDRLGTDGVVYTAFGVARGKLMAGTGAGRAGS